MVKCSVCGKEGHNKRNKICQGGVSGWISRIINSRNNKYSDPDSESDVSYDSDEEWMKKFDEKAACGGGV